MTTAAFTRMAARLLAGPLSQEATLRGSVPCRVNIEHGVEFSGFEGEVSQTRAVATLLKSISVRQGDTLVSERDGSFVIDSPAFQDNGHTHRFILR